MQIAAGHWDNRWFGHIFGEQEGPALQCFEKEYGAQKTALAKSDVQVNDSPGNLADTGGRQQIDDVGALDVVRSIPAILRAPLFGANQ
jgi:hypothetical protein